MRGRCRDCTWWDREHARDAYSWTGNDYSLEAQCRCGGPRADGQDVWPRTTADAWCQGFTPMTTGEAVVAEYERIKADIIALAEKLKG